MTNTRKPRRDFWLMLRARLRDVPSRQWWQLFALSACVHIVAVAVLLVLLFGGEQGGGDAPAAIVLAAPAAGVPEALDAPDKIADVVQDAPDVIDLAEVLELPLIDALDAAQWQLSESAALAPALPLPSQSLVQRAEGGGLISGVPQSFADYITRLQESGLDVLFVIDATGSMVWVHELVRARIEVLATYIRSLVPLARFGLIVYRDYHDPEFVTRQVQPRFDIDAIKTFMAGIDAQGGGDIPEAITAALRLTEGATQWRAGAQRVVIVVGDAPPHANEAAEALAIAARLKSSGGRLSALDSRVAANRAALGRFAVGSDVKKEGVMRAFRHLARAGGGTAASLSDEKRLMKTLALLIFDDRFHDDIAPFLANLE